jgi:hypothetical protein
MLSESRHSETSAALSERVGASAPSAVVMFQNHLSRQLFHLSRIFRLYYSIHVMSACDRASGIKVRTFHAVFPLGGNADVSGWDVPPTRRSRGVWGGAPKVRRSRGARGGAKKNPNGYRKQVFFFF